MTKKEKLDTIIHILDVAMIEKNKVNWIAFIDKNGQKIVDEIDTKLSYSKNLVLVSDLVFKRMVQNKNSITGIIFDFSKLFKDEFLKKIQNKQTDPQYKHCLALKTNK